MKGIAVAGVQSTNPTLQSDDLISSAYHTLRERIVHGRLAPGTRVMEREIAQRLGISRTPVRSALHRLQQEGYVIASTWGKGTQLLVSPLTREDARELFGIVGEVEGLGARWAAELRPPARAHLVQELKIYNADLKRAAAVHRPDRNLVFDVDGAFHRCYMEAGAGPRLLALHDAVKPQAERYIRLYVSALLDELDKSVDEHTMIMEQIEAGDPDLAQRAVQVNWRNAGERLSTVIDGLGERGSW
jgi:DNA-binding GntR family transcriptional regulator